MKLFGGISQNNITYITDIRANAKGFEQLANSTEKGKEAGLRRVRYGYGAYCKAYL